MYFIGINAENIHVHAYESDLQDFSGVNGSSEILSEWVFNQVKLFFEKSKNNETIQMNLKKKKLILFLHLLSTDVSGHIDKPHSK